MCRVYNGGGGNGGSGIAGRLSVSLGAWMSGRNGLSAHALVGGLRYDCGSGSGGGSGHGSQRKWASDEVVTVASPLV